MVFGGELYRALKGGANPKNQYPKVLVIEIWLLNIIWDSVIIYRGFGIRFFVLDTWRQDLL